MSNIEGESSANDALLLKPTMSIDPEGQPTIHLPLELNIENGDKLKVLVESQFAHDGVKTVEIDFTNAQLMDSFTAGLLLSIAKTKPDRVSLVLSGVTDGMLEKIFESNPGVARFFEIKKPAADQE